ncbi:MAG: POTRA domain-containing protein [Candidatus Eisenbacteria bacterium]
MPRPQSRVEDRRGSRARLRRQEGKRVKIESVDFAGNQAFSDDDLRGKVSLKPNGLFRHRPYTAARMREDVAKVEDYYHNHGYKDGARVTDYQAEFSQDYGTTDLHYTVEEGPFYSFGDLTWSGNEAVSTDALDAAASIRPGTAFSQEKLNQATSGHHSLYTERDTCSSSRSFRRPGRRRHR